MYKGTQRISLTVETGARTLDYFSDSPIFNSERTRRFPSLALSRPSVLQPNALSPCPVLSLTLLIQMYYLLQLAWVLCLSPVSTRQAFLSGAPVEDLGGCNQVERGEGVWRRYARLRTTLCAVHRCVLWGSRGPLNDSYYITGT